MRDFWFLANATFASANAAVFAASDLPFCLGTAVFNTLVCLWLTRGDAS